MIIAALKMVLFVLLCLVIVPLQLLVLLVHRGRGAYILPHIWHCGVCAIFRIRVERHGDIYKDSQVIYMGNHLSYLDISALASVICYGSFVAKKDVAGWPVFGFLSKLQQTAFVSREREDARAGAQALDVMLRAGKNLIIFPEGTSTEGVEVLPFKSSLFSIAMREDMERPMVQPFTIQLLSVDGAVPQSFDARSVYAWPRELDMELHHHLWRFAKSKGAVLRVTFSTPIAARDHENRKTLAKACHDAVSTVFNESHRRAQR